MEEREEVTSVLGVRLTAGVREGMKEAAKQDGRSLTKQIEYAMKLFLKERGLLNE